ncbi:methyltransferase domain-containing protein, partial [Candidatus Pacearchaeota archaeon]|nr:methyltransferase domain-containing protein [Candidatus Pacearchaeota archaeon]
MEIYTDEFYMGIQEGSRKSAKEVIPIVLELIKAKSIIDVGCGVGTWLSEFKKYGVEDVFGVDGDYINKKSLQIPENCFMSMDLKKPLKIEKQFDLVVSLEVAEHLPVECSEMFIDFLVSLGPIILFSAAIPFQGGNHHINEQWPDYWAKLFQNKEYVAIDCIRKKIWQNENVEWWYAQNILLFVKSDVLEKYPKLKKEFEDTNFAQLSIVHPKRYLISSSQRDISLKKTLYLLPSLIKKTIR